jgi:hypothetical protein
MRDRHLRVLDEHLEAMLASRRRITAREGGKLGHEDGTTPQNEMAPPPQRAEHE